MALDMFLKLNGVTGESKDKIHINEIDALSWTWGMTNSGSAHVGGGAGSVQDVTLSKFVDSSSPKLMLVCCNGTHYPSAVLTVRKAGGPAAVANIVQSTTLTGSPPRMQQPRSAAIIRAARATLTTIIITDPFVDFDSIKQEQPICKD
jgi:Type VI secretion system effector, Hcp